MTNHMSCHSRIPIAAVLLCAVAWCAELHAQSAMAPMGMSGTSADLFVMAGSDIDRPGLLPRANFNIGIGHTFAFLKKDPLGDELTFSYMYENAGTHGFLHTNYGEHTDHWNPIAAATVLGQTKAPPSTPSPQNALPSQAKP